MTTYIAILRGINVGGNRKIMMVDLKKMLARTGFENIITYIQSGNIILDSDAAPNEIAETIKQLIFNCYGFNVPVMVRTVEEMREIVATNPYTGTAEITQLHVTFLSTIPQHALVEGVKTKAKIFAPDEVALIGKNAFIKCKGLYHESKLTNAFFEKCLHVSAATRNWKTVTKLVELCNGH